MAKRKMRKFEEGGDVDPLEAANASEDSQAIMEQARGEEILKRMRDTEASQQEMPKPRMKETPIPRAKASPDVMKPTPKATMVEKTVVKTEPSAPKARPNENYSNEGRLPRKKLTAISVARPGKNLSLSALTLAGQSGVVFPTSLDLSVSVAASPILKPTPRAVL
jgi:hypothetical protein